VFRAVVDVIDTCLGYSKGVGTASRWCCQVCDPKSELCALLWGTLFQGGGRV